jgi:Flp pilus assembly protein TadG
MPLQRSRNPSRSRSRGQSLVEFAIAFPVLMLLIGAIVQFGVIFWGQNTLTQVARDTGRWASTQAGCDTTSVNVVATANSIAAQSSLIGYSTNMWTSSNVSASWTGTPCPPANNTQVDYVTITINHQVPIFFPWIPGSGNLTTVAQFRMEPRP